MLNQYPLWKNTLIALLLIMGCLYALPNLFGEDPAIQISPAHVESAVDMALLERAESALDRHGLTLLAYVHDSEDLVEELFVVGEDLAIAREGKRGGVPFALLLDIFLIEVSELDGRAHLEHGLDFAQSLFVEAVLVVEPAG